MAWSLTVLFRTRIDDTRASMRKLGQLDAVLLAQQALVVSTLSDVVDLDRLVARRRHEQLSIVIIVN